MERVKIAELKDNLSKYLRAAEAGASYEVTDRDRPIARIVPVRERPKVEIRPAKRPFAEIRDRKYPPAKLKRSSLEYLLEERGDR
jgi:prevent-host-death family protein